VLKNADQFRPGLPPALLGAKWAGDYNEVSVAPSARPVLVRRPGGYIFHDNETSLPSMWCELLMRLSFAMLEHCFEFFFKRSRRNSECAKSRPVL
jgi:hypothetical protein